MHKVITVSLNGNAYQLEEDAYEAVRTYLENAERALATNPDRTEILQDLEQAIADKCDAFLGRNKNVVAASEARQILREMGPVDGIAPQPGSAADAERPFAATDSGARAAPRQRRLYRLTNDGMLGGVCAGVAAYFGADVVWVRLAYVLIAIFTSGLWILVWLVQLFITPKAITPEDIAAAHGDPLSAREVVERAKKGGRAAAESIRDVANNLNDALHRG